MKKYKIKLLTSAGVKIEDFTNDPNTPNCLENFEKEMINKHGTFITLEAKEI